LYNFREEVTEMFKELDADLDGKLSWEEVTGEETKTEMAFKAIDSDGNGFITKQVNSHIMP